MSAPKQLGDAKQFRIAPVKTLADFEQAVKVQLAVWGYSDSELVPKRVFLVAQRIGGQVLGAFDGEALVGSQWRYPAITTASHTCTRTCWPCCRSIATRGWGGG